MREISHICRERGVLLHMDMVQSFGKIDADLSLVDAASFAAHKFYGPKGVGFLFLRSGLSIQPIMFGGAHENEPRTGNRKCRGNCGNGSGCGDGKARSVRKSEQKLRDELWTRIAENVPDAKQNGANAPRLANTLNVSLLEMESEMLLIALDLEGVCASSGSACMVGSVLRHMFCSPWVCQWSARVPQFDSHSVNGQRLMKSRRLETPCGRLLIA